ncbi:intraflagellar transport protein 57 homolog [Bradysia coprophila]|uniref:intraflagellar transport protein 57 homolog n=1 Tax=Bradysia coprophila TaxID=38358 RepID=UPI00187DCEB5|nr:intraflagellar transport protein 57 homolog [Bradysia coprophila]XP_037034144.1 intraflagellar transport protein 57 homolog [Bradysia coprophila]
MIKPDFQMVLEAEENTLMYICLYQMDDLMEKLKILNYERLLSEMKMKPLGRYYFLKSVNPGEQFFMFTSLCAWLIRQSGRPFEQPQEFHDPSLTIANIVKVLQEMDISTDFPTSKLMQGAGFICWYILDCLATQTMKLTTKFLSPQIQDEEDVAVEYVDNENEIILERVEEEQNALFSDDSDDDADENALLDLKGRTNTKVTGFPTFAENNLTDIENWRLEFERALPQLKVVVKSESRDWRAHWEQMKNLQENINSTSETTQNQLQRLQNDIVFAMEKIEIREKHLNNDLSALIQQYKTVSVDYSQIRNAIQTNDAEKMDFDQQLKKVEHNLENVKIQMEQRGNTMSDGSPLINIKKAIAKIKEEIIEMELEIGVLKHSLDQDIIKQNALYAELDPVPDFDI